MLRAVPLGCGSYLPERVMENAEFAERLDTSHEWIVARTGIERRHIAAPGQTTSDLAVAAARDALAHAGIDGTEIDAVVLATSTPDNTFPASATQVQQAIGMTGGFAFDMQAVCAGFVFAMGMADSLIRAGTARRVMVIGAETFSRLLDWQDRATCVLFGDGAGAVILEAQEQPGATTDRGILAARLRSDGAHRDILFVDGGPSSTGEVGHLRMQGREVFKHAVVKLADIARDTLDAAGVEAEALDWLVPHQANIRIIEGTAKKLGLPLERVVTTVADHGNTSAASIPLALTAAVRDDRIRQGDLLLIEGIGGGLAWGAAAIRW